MKRYDKLMASVLSVAMVFQMGAPITFALENDSRQISKTISGWVAPKQTEYTLPIGADEETIKEMLALPETLTAQVKYVTTEEMTIDENPISEDNGTEVTDTKEEAADHADEGIEDITVPEQTELDASPSDAQEEQNNSASDKEQQEKVPAEQPEENNKPADAPISPAVKPVEKVVVEEVEVPVTWESDKKLSTEETGEFTYTAALADKDSFVLAEGVEMPSVTVKVVENQPMVLSEKEVAEGDTNWDGGTWVVNPQHNNPSPTDETLYLSNNITVTGDTTLILRAPLQQSGDATVTVVSGATLTVQGDRKWYTPRIVNNGTLKLENVQLDSTSSKTVITNNGTMTMTGGMIRSTDSTVIENNGTLRINGGEILANTIAGWSRDQTCLLLKGGSCEISGNPRIASSGYTKAPVDMQGGTLTMNGGTIEVLDGNTPPYTALKIGEGVSETDIHLNGGTIKGGISGLTVTITLDANDGSFSSETTKSVTADSGAKISDLNWETPTKAGYIFKGWSMDEAGSSLISQVPVKSCTVYAVWQDPSHAPISGIQVLQSSGQTNDNESADKAFDGRDDTKWCDNTQNPKDTGWIVFKLPEKMVLSNMTVTHAEGHGTDGKATNTKAFSLQRLKNPESAPQNLDRSFCENDANWESLVNVDNSTQEMVTNTSIPQNDGYNIYRFNVTDGDGSNNNWEAVRIHEIELYGKVTPETVELTFKTNGATSGSYIYETVEKGKPYRLPECTYTRENYQFIGWGIDGEIKQPGEEITFTDDTIILAQWKENEIISVDITWGSMEFTYNEATKGTWNPAELKYDGGTPASWTCDTDADKITVKNNGTVKVNVECTYAVTESGITANFKDDGQPITDQLPLEKDAEKQIFVSLDGTLTDKEAVRKALGTVTLKISKGGE